MMMVQFFLQRGRLRTPASVSHTLLTVNTSFSNQVSVELGIHADLCVVHSIDLLKKHTEFNT